MDRRNFIKSLLASGVLGASPLLAKAAGVAATATQPVSIVVQEGLPRASELAAGLERAFGAAGLPHALTTVSSADLGQFVTVSRLLEQAQNGRLIGVMDDAAAVIFQELAAARGAAGVARTHHRYGGAKVRHCCTAAVQEASVSWTDPVAAHAGKLSRFYAEMLGGRLPPDYASGHAGTALPGLAGPSSLVSFLITT